jgi:hypothetical protein
VIADELLPDGGDARIGETLRGGVLVVAVVLDGRALEKHFGRRKARRELGVEILIERWLLIKQAGLKRTEAQSGAVILIQRFGSAANLNIHLHCLVLDGVYRTTEGLPVFHAVHAATATELQALLLRIIKCLMNRMHRDVQL